ncbi:MAG: hypothetical protein ACOH2N_08145 [Devosia sp.]
MANEPVGRQVQVKSKFHSAAITPGGVDRRVATQAAEKTVSDMQGAVRLQMGRNLDPLVRQLRRWEQLDPAAIADVTGSAAAVRDLAGLVNQHLVTEVAMYTFDCLDAVLVDGVRMDAREAACFADALDFARSDLCLGSDMAPYAPLLRDLEALTALVVGRIIQPG